MRKVPLMALLLLPRLLFAQHPVEGVWILDRIVEESPAPLTAAGAAIQQAYDLLEDDPSLRCEPASLGRVWGNPNTRTGITLQGDTLLLAHELFDLRRTIPASAAAPQGVANVENLEGTAFTTLGAASSFAVEGEQLRIDSRQHSAGYIRTGTGYPQGEGGSAVETFWRDGEFLMLELVYRDPLLFTGDFRILHRLVGTGESAVPEYNCTDADYDWFEHLNEEATAGTDQ